MILMLCPSCNMGSSSRRPRPRPRHVGGGDIIIICLSVLVLLHTIVGRSCDASDLLRLPTFVASHMVLQREPFSSRIWGWASPGANVTASLDNGMTRGSSTADANGSWSIDLPPQPAGDGHALHITDGDDAIDLLDVSFGDVYLCSGQSNMEMSVLGSFNATEEIADSVNYPNLRLATVQLVTADTPQDDAPSKSPTYAWARSGPDAMDDDSSGAFGYFSATCYFFGRDLYKALDGKVPIGLVASCWGGQKVETFMSPDALADQTCGGTRPLGVGEQKGASPTTSLRGAQNGAYFQEEDPWVGADWAVDAPQTTQLWNAMIHPLLPMRFIGAVWYQGEANAGDPGSYSCHFPAMITDWRRKFDNPDLSFFYVELAPLKGSAWSEIREAQRAATQLPNVAFATTIDIGDPSCPFGGVHSRRKQEVGRRLSLAVRSVQYGERGGLVYTGPSLMGVQLSAAGYGDSATTEIRLSFVPGTADGLHHHETPECDECCFEMPFHVLDSSGTWVRVDDVTNHGLVEIHLLTNVSPVYGIRYAWDPYPQCVLYNGAGGPDDHAGIAAAPFEWCALPSGKPAWTGEACQVNATAAIAKSVW